MRTTTTLLLLSLLAAACGGRVDEATPWQEGTAPPARPAPAEDRPAPPRAPSETMAEGVGTPSALALSSEAAYFVTRSAKIGGELVETGALFVAFKAGGGAHLLAADKRGATYDAVAVSSGQVVVGASDGRVLRLPARGGAVTEIAAAATAIVAVAASGDDVYYATVGGEIGHVGADGAATTLATIADGARALAATEDGVLVAGGGASAEITRVGRDGTTRPLARAGGDACGLVRAADKAVWTAVPAEATARGAARSIPLGGGDVSTVAEGDFAACALAADTESVFFVTSAPSDAKLVRSAAAGAPGLALMRAPIAGGAPTRVDAAAAPLSRHGALAVDARHVYWLDREGLRRTAK